MAEPKVINLAQRKLERMGGSPPPKIDVSLPDFISPQTIGTLTDAQLDQVLSLVRVRRMAATQVYERTQREKRQVEEGKALHALDKKQEQVYNELERAFKALDKLELRVNEMRALRLQAGLTF